jgi:radical SAM superfamily enzyme YgiQ (UPF0313 family)
VKRILLVNPLAPGFEQRLFPPLALAVLAGALPDGYEARIVDEHVQPVDFEADLAAISATTYSIRRAYQLCGEFRKRGIPVVLGGNHPTILPGEASRHTDSVVVGDGETVLPRLLEDFERRRLKRIYTSGRYAFDRHLLPRRDLLGASYRFDSLETVRGCPLRCDFCSVTRFHGATYRYKPLRLIDAELAGVRKKTIFVVDDNIIGLGRAAERRAMELFDLLRSHRVRWMGQASINIADSDELLRKAKDSGCLFLFVGFESLDPAVLRGLHKSLNLRRLRSGYAEVVKRIHDHGIGVMGSFIIGTDWDTRDSIRRLKESIVEAGIDIPNITHLTPYPGTRVYETLKRRHRLPDVRFWLHEPFPVFTHRPARISVGELKALTLDLVKALIGVCPAVRRFVRTLFTVRSLRIASFSLAQSLASGRLLKRNVEQQDV